MRNNTEKRAGKKLLIVAVAAVLAVVGAGTLAARYITRNQEKAEMLSSNFHISSNYLETEGATYTVTDVGNGISFSLYNFEKENVALIASEDITYKIEAEDWNVTVKENGADVAANNGTYVLPGGSAATHTIQLQKPEDSEKDTVKVTVTTTKPYRKTLKAEFTVVGKSLPDYSVEDMGSYVVVTIHSNDYSENIAVKWSANLSPDNTDPLMASWADEEPTYLKLDPHTTYSLIFVENQEGSYAKEMIEGTTEVFVG